MPRSAFIAICPAGASSGPCSRKSVLGNLRLIEKWRPKRAYMVHYSGYEDREHANDPVNGPMDAARFRDELRRVANGRDIQPAEHGMILGDTAPWPV